MGGGGNTTLGSGGATGQFANPSIIDQTAAPQAVPPFGTTGWGNNPSTASLYGPTTTPGLMGNVPPGMGAFANVKGGATTPTGVQVGNSLPSLQTLFTQPVSATPVFNNSQSFPQPPIYGTGQNVPVQNQPAPAPAPAPAAPAVSPAASAEAQGFVPSVPEGTPAGPVSAAAATYSVNPDTGAVINNATGQVFTAQNSGTSGTSRSGAEAPPNMTPEAMAAWTGDQRYLPSSTRDAGGGNS